MMKNDDLKKVLTEAKSNDLQNLMDELDSKFNTDYFVSEDGTDRLFIAIELEGIEKASN